jgi:hypothetical protein
MGLKIPSPSRGEGEGGVDLINYFTATERILTAGLEHAPI